MLKFVASRIIASSGSQASLLHTSAAQHAQVSRQNVARGVKKLNNLRKEERWKQAQASRPSVILGTRDGEEAKKWEQCLLAKVLVDMEELVSSNELVPSQQPIGLVELPKQTSFGVGKAEKELLFGTLPVLSSTRGKDLLTTTAGLKKRAQQQSATFSKTTTQGTLETAATSVQQAPTTSTTQQFVSPEFAVTAEDLWRANAKQELRKANIFAKVIDLRNANADGIAYENRRRIIEAFSTPENPFDTGRSEVQAALLTYKIRNLWTHLKTFKRDRGNIRGLRMLVHKRAKVLKYLKNVDQNRYEILLEQLALEVESVEGELVV